MPNILFSHMITDEELTYNSNQLDEVKLNLSSKNLVNFEGINSTEIAIITEEESLQIISAKSLHEQPDILNLTDANVKRFDAPYLPFETKILATDIQNLKPIPGSEQTPNELVEAVLMKRIARMDMRYAVTFEWLLMNMLKGKIMKNISEELVNLYTLMGKTKKTLDFALNDPDTNVLQKCAELRRMVKKGLYGDVSTSIEVQVSDDFYDQLISHAKVEKAYENFQGNSNLLVEGQDEDRFYFGKVWFERNDSAVGSTKFVDDYKGHAYARGTIDTFGGTYSPANMIQYANTEGQRTYISTENLKHGVGAEILMQSRPAAFCQRLDSLVEVSTPSS